MSRRAWSFVVAALTLCLSSACAGGDDGGRRQGGDARPPPPAGPGEPAHAVKAGEPLYVWLTAERCADGQPFSAWVTPAGADSVRSTLDVGVELDRRPGQPCAKRFKVYGFSFPEPGSYDLHFVLGEEGSASSQHFVIRYDVAAADARGPDQAWEGEPAGSIDWCNTRPCNEVIEGLLLDVDRYLKGRFSISKDMGRSAVGTLTIHLRSTVSPLAGTFEISYPADLVDASAVAFNAGEFAVRKGRLALRSTDRRYHAYLSYIPYHDVPNWRWHDVLAGVIPVNPRLEVDGSLFPCCLPRSSEPL